ncbi:MAG: acyl-CoA dehydrogenase family protein [Gammaproteobacteria bacterium]|nr:acyl-CoA dehydrogenase family protein [Gammaproteobacteria bacterium]
MMLAPFFTEEHLALQSTFRRFVTTSIIPHVNRWDEEGKFPLDLHIQAAELGMFGFGIESEYGGLGFDDALMRAIISVEMGRSGATGVAAELGARNITTGLIAKLADSTTKSSVLPKILNGSVNASLGITEPSGGSDVARLLSRATSNDKGWLLNGSKTFITGSLTSQYFVIAARTGGAGLGGISLFLLEKGTPGFDIVPLDKKMGWWCSSQASLFFNDCQVGVGALLGKENSGFTSIMHNFNLERLSLAAMAVGMAQVCFEYSMDYAKSRKTFGKSLVEHQVIGHKLADMSSKIDSLEAYLWQVCWQINTQKNFPVAEVCKLKFLSTQILEYCASQAMQILGGAGYLRGNPVERIYREVKVIAIGGGSEEIMRDLAIKQMLIHPPI